MTQPNAIIGQPSIIRYVLNATSSPDRHAAGNDLAAADPQHEQRADAHEQTHAREVHALQPNQRAVAHDVLLVRAPEALDLERLLSVGTHDADTGQRLLRHRADVGELFLDLLEPMVNRRAEVADDDRHKRQGHERQWPSATDRSTPSARSPTTNVRPVLDGVHHRRPDHHAHRAEIVGRARHQIAGASAAGNSRGACAGARRRSRCAGRTRSRARRR